jgi:hypothetical protein
MASSTNTSPSSLHSDLHSTHRLSSALLDVEVQHNVIRSSLERRNSGPNLNQYDVQGSSDILSICGHGDGNSTNE